MDETNIVNIVERAYSTAFPSADELWDRGGATMVNGIPFFDVEVVGEPAEYSSRPLYVKDGRRHRRIGSSMLLGYTMSDGIDRMVSVRRLDDGYRSDVDMITTASTAWTTTVGGYVGRRDERIAAEIGLQTVAIGADGSTNTRLMDKGALISVSLAKSAQSEQAILQDVSNRFDLPTRHYGLGDSRGAMIKPAHSLYAPYYGNEMVFTDIKAPCVPEKLEIEDLPKVGLWLAMEALGATSVTASLLKDRDVGVLVGTFDLHPRSVPTSLGGIMPALMSGEAGRLAELAPDDMKGHVVLYGHDILSSADRWKEIYATKPDMITKDVPRGSHAHLLGRISLQIDRVDRAVTSLHYDSALDVDYVVSGHKPDYKKQAELQLAVNI